MLLVSKLNKLESILEIEHGYGGHLMTTFVPFETALQMLAVAYLVSAVVLVAASYIGWVAIETLEGTRKL